MLVNGKVYHSRLFLRSSFASGVRRVKLMQV